MRLKAMVIIAYTIITFALPQPTNAADIIPNNKAWTLALGAVINRQNHGDSIYLGGFQQNEKSKERAKMILSKWWGVESTEDLLFTLSWLKLQGHRKEYNEIKTALNKMSESQLRQLKEQLSNTPELLSKLEHVLATKDSLGEAGILAWDMGRFVNVCGWGYLAGYINEKGTWQMLRPLAKDIQRKFNSWEQYSKSYLAGREFWSSDETKNKEIRSIIDSLLNDSDSPWNLHPWSTNLD